MIFDCELGCYTAATAMLVVILNIVSPVAPGKCNRAEQMLNHVYSFVGH